MKKKKILVFDSFARAGAGISILKNLTNVLRTGTTRYEWIFYCNPSLKETLNETNSSIKLIFGPIAISTGGIWGYLLRKRLLIRTVKEVSPDVVLCMNTCDALLPCPTVLFPQNALYFLERKEQKQFSMPVLKRLKCFILRYFTKKSITRVNHIVVSTESFYKRMSQYTAISTTPHTVCPFGVSTLQNSFDSRDFDNCFRLLCLQYNLHKGIEVAVNALAVLKAEGVLLKLTITDNLQNHTLPQARKIWALIQSLNLSEQIECIGIVPHEKLGDVYNSHHIFLFPSYIESFGLGLAEAMSNSLPCVASDTEVHRELGGNDVLYFDKGNYYDLANKIKFFTNSSQQRKSYGMRAKSRSTLFTWNNHVQRLEDAFDISLNCAFKH